MRMLHARASLMDVEAQVNIAKAQRMIKLNVKVDFLKHDSVLGYLKDVVWFPTNSKGSLLD